MICGRWSALLLSISIENNEQLLTQAEPAKVIAMMCTIYSLVSETKKNSSYENSPRPHQSPWAFNTQPFPHVKKDKLQGIFCIFSISKALQMDSMGTTKHNLITLITLFANSGRGQSSKWSTKWFLTSYINGSLWTSFHIVPFLGNKTAGLPVRLNNLKRRDESSLVWVLCFLNSRPLAWWPSNSYSPGREI